MSVLHTGVIQHTYWPLAFTNLFLLYIYMNDTFNSDPFVQIIIRKVYPPVDKH